MQKKSMLSPLQHCVNMNITGSLGPTFFLRKSRIHKVAVWYTITYIERNELARLLAHRIELI